MPEMVFVDSSNIEAIGYDIGIAGASCSISKVRRNLRILRS